MLQKYRTLKKLSAVQAGPENEMPVEQSVRLAKKRGNFVLRHNGEAGEMSVGAPNIDSDFGAIPTAAMASISTCAFFGSAAT